MIGASISRRCSAAPGGGFQTSAWLSRMPPDRQSQRRHAGRRTSRLGSRVSAKGSDDSFAVISDGLGKEDRIKERWKELTTFFVSGASLPFGLLVLPQAYHNFINISNGNAAALSVISWEGYTTGLLGNTLMCSHFVGRGESSAMIVQMIGVASNCLILSQVALTGHMPLLIFLAVLALAVTAAIINVAKIRRVLSTKPWSQGPSVWRVWQLSSAVIGLGVLPQILYSTFFPTQSTFLPGVLGFAFAAWWVHRKVMGKSASARRTDSMIDRLPGWSSTILFALSPLPQLVRNFTDPSSLGGLSVGTMLLALLGNALMMPRALLTRDLVWLVGTSWACLAAGWGQLLSLYLGVSATGDRFLSGPAFLAISAVLLLYLLVSVCLDAWVKGLPNPLSSIEDIIVSGND